MFTTKPRFVMVIAAFLLMASVAPASHGGMPGQKADASKAGAEKAAAPLPEGLRTGKKVFLGFSGVDRLVATALSKLGGEYHPYNALYAALKNSGAYELVANPSEADLVMEVSFVAPLSSTQVMDTFDPQIRVEILDAKTHFTLWTIRESVEGSLRKDSFEKNIEGAIANTIKDLQDLRNGVVPGVKRN